eukprot:gene52915-59588_t
MREKASQIEASVNAAGDIAACLSHLPPRLHATLTGLLDNLR